MFVSIFKPASQSARARFAFSPEQIMAMFGHKAPVKGDRLDIARSGNKIRLTANAKGRFALSSVMSRRLPGCVTILAAEVGMLDKGLGRDVLQSLDKKTKAMTVTIPTSMISPVKTPAKKATPKIKAKPAKKTTATRKAAKKTAKRKAVTIKATVTASDRKMTAALKAATGKAERRQAAIISPTVNRPATTMLGDAVAKLNKILAVTPTATVTTKNNRVLVTAERKIIISYV